MYQTVLDIWFSHSFQRYSWVLLKDVCLRDGGGVEWGPLLKQKLYIDCIFLFQSKILNFATIGCHQISLSTFVRNFAVTAMFRNSKNSNSSQNFLSKTFKNKRVITSNISVVLKPERSVYNDLFKKYRPLQTNKLTN